MAKKSSKKENKKTDTEQTGLFKEVISVIFDIQPKQVERIMNILQRSEDIINVKTRMVLDHAGPRAVKLIRQAVEYARHEGSEKHETDKDDFEMTKKVDISDILSIQKPHSTSFQRNDDSDETLDQRENKPIHECTFKEYLMELMVSDDPQQALRDVQLASKSKDNYQKVQNKKILDNRKQIAAQPSDDKLKADELRINDSERKLIAQKKLLADKQKRQGKEEDNKLNIRGDTGERPAAGMVP